MSTAASVKTPPTTRHALLQGELVRYVAILKERYQPQKIWLFGSLAQAAVHDGSDIDLIVVKETNERFLNRIKEVLRLLQPQVALDVLVYTPTEFETLAASETAWWREVMETGELLYDATA